MFDTKVVPQLGCVEQLVALLFKFKELAPCNLLFRDLKTIGFVPRGTKRLRFIPKGIHRSQIALLIVYIWPDDKR